MKISFSALLPLLLASTARAFTVPSAPRTTTTTKLPAKKMFDSVEDAIAEAKKLCDEGASQEECAMMWDIVEELEAADSHTSGIAPAQEVSKKDQYALEKSGFEILEKEVQGQMDQLKALTAKMAELGVSGPSLIKLDSLSDDVKLTLAQAKLALPKSL